MALATNTFPALAPSAKRRPNALEQFLAQGGTMPPPIRPEPVEQRDISAILESLRGGGGEPAIRPEPGPDLPPPSVMPVAGPLTRPDRTDAFANAPLPLVNPVSRRVVAPPTPGVIPTRDRRSESRDALLGSGIASILSRLTGNGDYAPLNASATLAGFGRGQEALSDDAKTLYAEQEAQKERQYSLDDLTAGREYQNAANAEQARVQNLLTGRQEAGDTYEDNLRNYRTDQGIDLNREAMTEQQKAAARKDFEDKYDDRLEYIRQQPVGQQKTLLGRLNQEAARVGSTRTTDTPGTYLGKDAEGKKIFTPPLELSPQEKAQVAQRRYIESQTAQLPEELAIKKAETAAQIQQRQEANALNRGQLQLGWATLSQKAKQDEAENYLRGVASTVKGSPTPDKVYDAVGDIDARIAQYQQQLEGARPKSVIKTDPKKNTEYEVPPPPSEVEAYERRRKEIEPLIRAARAQQDTLLRSIGQKRNPNPNEGGFVPMTGRVVQGGGSGNYTSQFSPGVVKYAERIAPIAQKYSVDPNLVLAVMDNESDGNPRIRNSSAGAIGLMQLMPGTAKDLGVDPTQEGQNLEGGVKYLSQLNQKYNGEAWKVLYAYNRGPGALDRAIKANGDDMGAALRSAPEETRRYVKQGLALYQGQPLHHSETQPRDNGRFASAGSGGGKGTGTPGPSKAPNAKPSPYSFKGSGGGTITVEPID